jgi:hypothetical protein
MYGSIVRGTKAKVGAFLLGHASVETSKAEPIFVIPLNPNKDGDKQGLVIAHSGSVFLGYENWLENSFWDVTGHADIEVSPADFRINDLRPAAGDIAFTGDAWLIAAGTTPSDTFWVNLKDGSLSNINKPYLRFPSWQVAHARNDLQSDILFELARFKPKV